MAPKSSTQSNPTTPRKPAHQTNLPPRSLHQTGASPADDQAQVTEDEDWPSPQTPSLRGGARRKRGKNTTSASKHKLTSTPGRTRPSTPRSASRKPVSQEAFEVVAKEPVLHKPFLTLTYENKEKFSQVLGGSWIFGRAHSFFGFQSYSKLDQPVGGVQTQKKAGQTLAEPQERTVIEEVPTPEKTAREPHREFRVGVEGIFDEAAPSSSAKSTHKSGAPVDGEESRQTTLQSAEEPEELPLVHWLATPEGSAGISDLLPAIARETNDIEVAPQNNSLPGGTNSEGAPTMAPLQDQGTGKVQDALKEVIQNLFDVQSSVHGYIDETHGVLVDNMIDLTRSLTDLQNVARSTPLPMIPPEIIDYVDDGRNPDIYTREFVELVQRGNAVINGKREAFADFSRIFADKLVEESRRRNVAKDPALSGGVDLEKEAVRVMVASGVSWKPPSSIEVTASTSGKELFERNGLHEQRNIKREENGDGKMESI